MSENISFLCTMVMIENVLCVYHNFSIMSVKAKCLIILRSIIEMIIVLILFGICVKYTVMVGLENITYIPVAFQFLTVVNNVVVLYVGIRQSKHFVSLIRTFNRVEYIYKDNIMYKRMLQNINRILIFTAITYILTRCWLVYTLYKKVNFFLQSGAPMLWFVLGVIFDTWIHSRYLMEFFVYHALIYMIGVSFKMLNASVVKTKKELHECRSTNEIKLFDDNTIEEWALIYSLLLKTCKQLNACFSVQFLIHYDVSLLYSIIIGYRICNMLIKQVNYDFFGGNEMVFNLSYQVLGIISIMISGQRLNNQFSTLKVLLSEINNLLLNGSSGQKKVKDFLHYLTCDPLELKLLSTPIGMAMLPASFGVVVGYIVVALQFNHVV